MPETDTSELLRSGLLEGVSLLLARADEGARVEASAADAIRTACTGLGARVLECRPIPAGSPHGLGEAECEAEVERALAEAGSIETLVVDGADLYAAAAAAASGDESERARSALAACLDASWNVTRSLANRAFLERERPGRIVYVAPAPSAGEHAEAARAGLENLARTLSIEWARHAITVVTIAPGNATLAGEVAALTAYLASPAGAYFSGCLLDLQGP
jgi:NAD(P)-dependent dehydrogenase (short-subunit alcohol dehydrogenase family)